MVALKARKTLSCNEAFSPTPETYVRVKALTTRILVLAV